MSPVNELYAKVIDNVKKNVFGHPVIKVIGKIAKFLKGS